MIAKEKIEYLDRFVSMMKNWDLITDIDSLKTSIINEKNIILLQVCYAIKENRDEDLQRMEGFLNAYYGDDEIVFNYNKLKAILSVQILFC